MVCLLHRILQPRQLQLVPQWPSHAQNSSHVVHQHRPPAASAALLLYWQVSAGQVHASVHRFFLLKQVHDFVPHFPLEH